MGARAMAGAADLIQSNKVRFGGNKVRLGDRWRVRPHAPGLGARDKTRKGVSPRALARTDSFAAKEAPAAPLGSTDDIVEARCSRDYRDGNGAIRPRTVSHALSSNDCYERRAAVTPSDERWEVPGNEPADATGVIPAGCAALAAIRGVNLVTASPIGAA